jgi:hypothetical protein
MSIDDKTSSKDSGLPTPEQRLAAFGDSLQSLAAFAETVRASGLPIAEQQRVLESIATYSGIVALGQKGCINSLGAAAYQ